MEKITLAGASKLTSPNPVCLICTKKEDAHKFDFEVFFDIFAYLAFESYKNTKDKFSLEAYLYTAKYKQSLINKNPAKEAAILNFLSNLWRIAHDFERS